jgi:hypothetical protein
MKSGSTMFHFSLRDFAIPSLVTIWAAAVIPVEPAHALPGWEISIPKGVQAAADSAFASKKEAEDFLASTLPIATAVNPKYRSANGNQMAWITMTVTFGPSKSANGTWVSMSEEVLEFHNGVQISMGSHHVAFAIEDVKISERTDSGDLTEAGDAARAVMFTCNSGKCIQASYDDKPSTTDWADISLQDETTRNAIRKAFETIQQSK